jgi:hypothetical protein
MRYGVGAGFTHFAHAWKDAIRDPQWWGRTVSGMLTAPVVLETGSPILGRLAARLSRLTGTTMAEMGAAKPLMQPSELKPLTTAERQVLGDFLKASGQAPQFVPELLDGMASGARIDTLADDLRVVRYSGGKAGPVGRWLTEAPVRDPMRDLALKPGTNTASYLDTWIIPKGTTVVRSPVAPLHGMPGGATQVFVPDANVLRGAAHATGISAPTVLSAKPKQTD